MLEIRCPRDGTLHHASEEHIGKKLRCASCGQAVPIETYSTPAIASRSVDSPQRPSVTQQPPVRTQSYRFGRKTGWVVAFGLCVITGVLYFSAQKSAPTNVTSAGATDWRPPEAVSGSKSLLPVPSELSHPARSLRNGKSLTRSLFTQGNGELTIENDTNSDAVVNVILPSKDLLIRSVYIKANSQWTIKKLNPGSYRVIFATGTDWDNKAHDFTQNASYTEFGKSLEFMERTDDMVTHFTTHRISLQPVSWGNIPKIDIDRARFQGVMSQYKPPDSGTEAQ